MKKPEIINSIDYFYKSNRKINWNNDNNKDESVSLSQSELIDKILSIEAAIWVLMLSTHFDSFTTDNMRSIRRKLINEYEANYNEKYIEYNEQ